jgi:DNA polymerase-3 subunit epsilon
MREIVLDTETTGLNPKDGHRIVEIGCLELINHVPTGEVFHVYINPQRPMPVEAFEIHGLSDEFLADKQSFEAIAGAFIEFVRDGILVIHNAPFDMKFLNSELARAERPPLPDEQVIDTLEIAKRKHPGGANSLDALCRRYGVDNSGRVKHGALLDSELLAEVYLELIGGRQPNLMLVETASDAATANAETAALAPRPAPLGPRLTEGEREAHRELIDEIGDSALWRRFS